MTETWLDLAVRRLGPSSKTGYPGVSRRELGEIEGAVYHSVEGTLAGALAVLDGPRPSSWTFTVGYDIVYQHYPLEFITWHAGSPDANIKFVGIEHEGRAGEPLTPRQLDSNIHITRELRRLCSKIGANPPKRPANAEDFP